MRCAIAVAPLALLATSCGGKADPWAKSLAQRSEHVELTGRVVVAGKRQLYTASGDFLNQPDQGTMTMYIGETTVREVVTEGRIYLSSPTFHLPRGKWLSVDATKAFTGTQTPAQIFRAGTASGARIEDGLVRHVDIRASRVTMSIDFSRYGEPVLVHVPPPFATVREESR